MLGTVEKQQEGGGRFSARFFQLQDGWMTYYEDAAVIDKAREETFEVTAQIHYRDLPDPDAISLPRRLVPSSKSLTGYRVAGPDGSTFVKTMEGFVPMQHDGIDVLRPMGEETFIALTGQTTVCSSTDVSDKASGTPVSQGDVIVGSRVLSKTGGVMTKASHFGSSAGFIPLIYGGVTQLKSLGKAPGPGKQGKAYQLISFKAQR